MTALLVALGAAAGAPLRYLLAFHLDGRFPAGTLAVNVSGSALLGLLSALAVPGATWALLGTGFCGAFTTCSGFALQAHLLGGRRGTTYAVLTATLSVGACALGHLAGRVLGQA